MHEVGTQEGKSLYIGIKNRLVWTKDRSIVP